MISGLTGEKSMSQTILHVAVQKATGFNLISPAEFLALTIKEKSNLLLEGKVQFLNENGETVQTMEALRLIGAVR